MPLCTLDPACTTEDTRLLLSLLPRMSRHRGSEPRCTVLPLLYTTAVSIDFHFHNYISRKYSPNKSFKRCHTHYSQPKPIDHLKSTKFVPTPTFPHRVPPQQPSHLHSASQTPTSAPQTSPLSPRNHSRCSPAVHHHHHHHPPPPAGEA